MRNVFITMLPVVALLAGCSSHYAGVEPRGKTYSQEEMAAFMSDTDVPEIEKEYVIGVGDKLDVVFFVHKELTSVDNLVRTDGRISLSYVGDVMAAGSTPMQLDSILTARYSEVLRDPNLTVILRQPAEKAIYVLGQVKSAGGFPYRTKVTALQAIALAGGLDRGAKTTHVLVVRRKGPDKIVGIELNIAAVTSGYNVQNDMWLRNYDIVYVPKTRLQSVSEFIAIMNDILFPPVDIILRGWQVQVLRQQYELIQSRN